MRKLLGSYLRSEDGAITVDWVVLTAAIVGLQIVILLTPVREALVGVSDYIGRTIDSAAVTAE